MAALGRWAAGASGQGIQGTALRAAERVGDNGLQR